jgi:hypothetical protein
MFAMGKRGLSKGATVELARGPTSFANPPKLDRVSLRCVKCGRPAPATDSTEILAWEGGEMSLVTDDPLMFPELTCPLCKAQKSAPRDAESD